MSSPLFAMLTIFLIEFTCIYFVSTFFSKGNSFVATESQAMHHLERSDYKPFSRLIGPTYIKKAGQFPIKTGWQDSTLVFCNLGKAFKHNTICDSSGVQTHNHLVCKRTLNHFAKMTE